LQTFELITLLLVAVVALVWLAERIKIPYPMLLMIGGLALAISPWTPTIELEPEIVLGVFLPPILFQAAQMTSVRDFKANFPAIGRLAFGLVFATTALVAVAAHWVIPGIGWPAAFVLGAIVSPPDAVAATAIFQRLGAPRRIVTILEGESLINDASALVVYTFAVAAVTSGSFSILDAGWTFVVVVVVGLGVGLLAGKLLGLVLPRLGDPTLVTIVTLLTPFAVYAVGETLHGSGVLAVVMAGLVHGYESPTTMTATSRLRGVAIWDLVTIAVNGLVFILIGFELGALRETLSSSDVGRILWHGVVIVATLVAARFVYILLLGGITKGGGRAGYSRFRDLADALDFKSQVLVAWSGLRGVVTMATALALPLTVDSGAAFDHRDEIVLIAAFAIVVTLFGFGLPLPWILRKLELADDGSHEAEIDLAHKAIRSAMYTQLQTVVQDNPEMAEMFQPFLNEMLNRRAILEDAEEREIVDSVEEGLEPRIRIRQQMLGAAREALLELRDRGQIGDEVRREMERQLDFQEMSF
jgi:CPA1 family monovalent cation:H+ antiporter